MQFNWFGISWGGPKRDWWHLAFYNTSKGYRFFGPSWDWYDGPHYFFGFWWFAFYWVLPWGWANPDWEKIIPWVHDWKWLK